MGTIQTSISTSGMASIAERPKTFIHPISYSNLSFVSLSIIYTLISPLCSFFTACILQASKGPVAWSLCTRAQLFCFKVFSQSVASPIRIVISCTSIGLQVACFTAQGIIGVVVVTCVYNSGPIDAGPLFIAVVVALQRALISVWIAFIF